MSSQASLTRTSEPSGAAGVSVRERFFELKERLRSEAYRRQRMEKKWAATYQKLSKANKLLEHHVDELEYTKAQTQHEKAKGDAILESLGEGLVVTDTSGRIVLANRAAELLLGRQRAQMLGSHVCDVLHMEDEAGRAVPLKDRPYGKVSEGRSSSVTISDNCYYCRANGSRFPVSTTASAVTLDGEVRGKIVVFRDITKEKQIEQAKNEFVSIASHQLRTPLSTINWYVETLLIHAGRGDADTKRMKYLHHIHNANQRLVRLVNALLNVSRLELGTVVVEPHPVHLVNLVRRTVEDLQGEIAESEVILKEEYADDLLPIQLDPKITEIVVQNLISNAIKYMPERREKWVRVKVYAGGPPRRGARPRTSAESGIIVEVSDNGCGISRADRKKIFSKFFRCDVTRESNQEGSGLGLYISKKLIELMGGRIWLCSRVGKGTAFYVYLPKENKKVQIPLQQSAVAVQ